MSSRSTSSVASTHSVLALVTLSSVFAISYALHKQKNIMPATAPAASDPKLPDRFICGSFQNARSQKLFTINLPPADASSAPNAMAIVVHGIAEHCCRQGYIGLYESLSEAGMDVYAYDHLGHGRSDGQPRGYVEKFDYFVDDLLDYIKNCQAKYKMEKGGKCPPLVLIGQSMGALISAMAVLRLGSYHVAGLCITSPALGVDMSPVMKVQKFFAPVIDRTMPKANIVDGVRPVDMARNQKAVQAYIDDPLCFKGKTVARTAIQMSKSFDLIESRRGEITCPLLVIHGTDDRCTSIKASRDFFYNVGTPLNKKMFLQLPGMYHELLEEPETDQIVVSIIGFASSGGKEFSKVEGEEIDGLINVKFK